MEAGTLSIILFATLLGLLATGIWVGPVLLAVGFIAIEFLLLPPWDLYLLAQYGMPAGIGL